MVDLSARRLRNLERLKQDMHQCVGDFREDKGRGQCDWLLILQFSQSCQRGLSRNVIVAVELLSKLATTLTAVSRSVSLLAEILCDIRPENRKGQKDYTVPQGGKCEAANRGYDENQSHR